MKAVDQLLPNATVGDDLRILENIHQEDYGIAICERDIQQLGDDISQAIERGIVVQIEGTTTDIETKLGAYFIENVPHCKRLQRDVLDLVKTFEKVTEASSFRLSLSTVSGNMCRKFHTDINDLRLLCTYAGEGTLWVAEDEESRVVDVEAPINAEQIHQAQAGDVLILKGALYPNGNPVLHKSPAIESTGQKRLLLRLDTNNVLEF